MSIVRRRARREAHGREHQEQLRRHLAGWVLRLPDLDHVEAEDSRGHHAGHRAGQSAPSQVGSGGANGDSPSRGGNGGGFLHLTAMTLQLDGKLLANGVGSAGVPFASALTPTPDGCQNPTPDYGCTGGAATTSVWCGAGQDRADPGPTGTSVLQIAEKSNASDDVVRELQMLEAKTKAKLE